MNQRIPTQKKNTVYLVLFLYWLILLIWQNLRSAANRDSTDMIIKSCLIVSLTAYFLMRSRTVNSTALFVFFAYLLINTATKLTSSVFQFSDAMYYFFPLLLFLVTVGFGGNSTISKDELLKLFYMLTFTVLYIVAYSWIFQAEKYLQALSVKNAYGNELSSFLNSSHEFGYYLAFGIMAAIMCNDLDDHINAARRTYLIVVIVLFSISLILTYSRTAILMFAVMLLWYVFSSGQRKLKQILLAVLFLLAVVVIVDKSLREYFFEIVFKSNNDAGRDELTNSGLKIFMDAPIGNQLFGYNLNSIIRFVEQQFGHRNFHNAYIQTLVCNGVVGIVFPIGCFIYEAVHIARTMRIAPNWKRLLKLFYSFEAALMISMLFQTNDLFASSIDSYFLTLFGFLIPIYVDNALREDVFVGDAVSEDAGKN